MKTSNQIAKALLNKSFSEAKELVFKSLYAKASLALDETRFAVANSVFNRDVKTTDISTDTDDTEESTEQLDEEEEEGDELDEDIQTSARAAEMRTKIRSAIKRTDSDVNKLRYEKKTPHNPVKDRNYRAFKTSQTKRENLIAKDKAERDSQKIYGVGGKKLQNKKTKTA